MKKLKGPKRLGDAKDGGTACEDLLRIFDDEAAPALRKIEAAAELLASAKDTFDHRFLPGVAEIILDSHSALRAAWRRALGQTDEDHADTDGEKPS